jgi:hypothetical protein
MGAQGSEEQRGGLDALLAGPPEAEGADGAREVSLAALLEALASEREVLDEGFAREVAARLAGRAGHVRLVAADRLGLEDVVVTFHMDRSMRLVVTGNDPASGAEVTLRWRDRDFDRVALVVTREARHDPCTFATLDFSVRGAQAVLRAAVGGAEAGDAVTVRCLATLGEAVHYRCTIAGADVAVAPEALTIVG